MSSRPLVTLVNPNRLRPAVTPYALDILGTSLERAGFDAEVLDLNPAPDRWRAHLARYFRVRLPVLIGITVRNTDTIHPQEQQVFLAEHKEVINELRLLSAAPVVAGGAGFSSMPFALVDYFGIEYGVRGPGEEIICRLVSALVEGRSVRSVTGLIVNRGAGRISRVVEPPTAGGVPPHHQAGHDEDRVAQVNRTTPYLRRSGIPLKVDNLRYYRLGGLGNIMTENGGGYTGSHRVRFALRAVHAVVDEMECLTRQGVHDLHTTDSEFNLAIAHSKAVLREIVRRKGIDASSSLHRLGLWIYAQPAPFDTELADLLAMAGCRGITVAPAPVREDLLRGWQVTARGTRYCSAQDTERMVELAHERDILTMVEVLLGMPGETEQTVRECVGRMLGLDATVTGFTLGLRVFPYSPLGLVLARRCGGMQTVPGLQSDTATEPIVLTPIERCPSVAAYERQFMFESSGAFRPVYYFSPDLPEAPETVVRPDGRWHRTIDLLWRLVPAADRDRVMLPTAPGLTRHDADDAFLTSLVLLGHRGAYWSRWRDRDRIIAEGRAKGIDVPSQA